MGRVIWADILKIYSILAVIVIHSSAPLLNAFKKDVVAWNIGNFYDSISRWCIPVFFMLSGEFILEKVQYESFRKFYFKRFWKVVIPFVFWSAVYLLWRILVNKEDVSINEMLLLFLSEPAYYHLWFIYTLIGLYCLSPVIGSYLKSAGKRNLTIFLMLWFVFGSLVPTYEDMSKLKIYLSIGTPSQIFYFCGYFMLGYILKDFRINRAAIAGLCFLFLITCFFTAYLTFYLTTKSDDGKLVDIFYNYYCINIMLMSVSVFLVTKSIVIPYTDRRFQEIISTVASCVPGIYLIHAMVISLFKGSLLPFTFSAKTINPLFGVPVFTSVVFVVSLGLVLIIKQVPVINKLIP